jgi:hypothetical protein
VCHKPANKTKESLNSDGQLFTNINKTKESLNSDGQLCTNINKTKESLNSDSQLCTNINKTKESLNSDSQLCININKTKESLNSDGQLFTNINKTNNNLSSQTFTHINTTPYGVGNTDTDTHKNVAFLNQILELQPPSDNGISNDNTDLYKHTKTNEHRFPSSQKRPEAITY